MNPEDILKILKSRRSIRKFTREEVPGDMIDKILEAGQWAPSGRNNQPWRFSVIRNSDIKNRLGELTKYTKIVQESNVCIAVFFNIPSGYHRDKDMMSMGALLQNMLLAAEALGLGALWIGEILSRKDDVNRLLEAGDENELAAVIALGHPDEKPTRERKEMRSLMLKSFI